MRRIPAMRASVILGLGLVGCLLAGLLVSAVYASTQERPDPSPVTVPNGRVGDEISYAMFRRDAEGEGAAGLSLRPRDEAVLKGVESFRLERILPTLDRSGSLRDALLVRSNSTADQEGTYNEYVDLASRQTVRREFRHEDASAVGRSRLVTSTFEDQAPLLPGLALQGRTLRLGDELGDLFPIDPNGTVELELRSGDVAIGLGVPARATGPYAGLSVHYRAWVADRAVILGYDAYELRVESTVHIPRGVAGIPEPELQDATFTSTYSLWASPGIPYPVLIHVQQAIESPAASGVIFDAEQSLTNFRGGTGPPIPWARYDPRREPAPTNEQAERTSGAQTYPADGNGGNLPYPLSRAVADVQNDLLLIGFQQWRAQHPVHYLVSADAMRGEHSTSNAEGMFWRLVFADTSGNAYQVTAERTNNGPAPLTQDRGPAAVPPFQPADLPSRPVTIAAAERMWTLAASADYASRIPNHVHWGYFLDYESGQACLQLSRSDVTPMHEDLRRLVVGYNNQGSCIEATNNHDQSVIVVDTATGNLENAFEWRVNFEYGGLLGATPSAPPPLVPKTVPAGPRPPEVDTTAVAAGSLFALFLTAYFLPVVKFAGAKALLLMPGYMKLRKEEVLDNKVRDELLQLIRENPGIHASDLGRRVDAGWGTVVYHLSVLEKMQHINSLVDGRHKRFFPVGVVDFSRRGQLAVLRNETTKAIYEAIATDPGVIQGDVASKFALSPPAAVWHLKRLEECGLVGRAKKGRKVHYYPNETPPNVEPYNPNEAVEVA